MQTVFGSLIAIVWANSEQSKPQTNNEINVCNLITN